MNRENFLIGIIGLLLGVIIGFTFANSVNRNAAVPTAATTATNPDLPEGHPQVAGGDPSQGGMVPEVQAAIDQAKREPDNFDAQIKAAEFYYQIRKFDGAIEFLRRANQIKPDAYEIIVDLGNANFDAEKYDDAEKWYEAALAKKADDVNVRTDLGLTFIFRNPPDYDRAVKEFTRSLEIDPGHVQTLQNLTVAYTKKGDAQKALETLDRLEKTDPSNQAIARLREDIGKIGK
ncbi:MAG: tetratricopeptide repeat protein [Pyrinomonadaceae bacterium]